MAAVIRADFEHVVSRVLRRSGLDLKAQKAILHSLVDRNDVRVRLQDNFTLVYIMFGNRMIGCGMSKRRSDEEFDPIIGYNIALVRAVEEAVETLLTDAVLPKSVRKDSDNGRALNESV